MENGRIYLDQEGLKDLEEAFDAGAGDGWDSPEFEEIERESFRLEKEIQRRINDLSKVVLVSKNDSESLIDIGDVLNIDMKFEDEDVEDMTFKLVGLSKGKNAEGIEEVSINSPLGKAVYHKEVGDTVSYTVHNNLIEVLIKAKVNLDKEDVIKR